MPTTPTTGLHHVAFRAKDFDASVRFYKEGLGLTEKISWGEGDRRAVMLDAGNGNYLEIFAGGSAEPKPEGVLIHFALRSADSEASLRRAVAAGAVVTVPTKEVAIQSRPTGPTPVRIAFCRGPDGEIIEFFQNELT